MPGKDENARFPTTRWTEMEDLRRGGPDEQKALIKSLSDRYWRPVYAWLRRQGYGADLAEEYTQGFFCDIVLEHDLASRADRHRGRFRTFLLKALKAFVSDEYRKAHAQKRMPRLGLARLDDAEAKLPGAETQVGPDDLFIYMWASDFLREAFSKLAAEYAHSGRDIHWLVFKLKVYDPLIKACDAPSYEALCTRLDIPDVRTAAAMVTTVKRRFRSVLRRMIRTHVESEEAVDEEIRELFLACSRMDA